MQTEPTNRSGQVNRKFLLTALVLASTGCGHLQQAPLVYSSKATVGIEISTNSTETPGISMNVGYKQVDAAYVPVAVARACGSGNKGVSTEDRELCRERSFHEIRMISGSSDEGGKSTVRQASQLEAMMSEFDQKQANLDSAKKAVDSNQKDLKAATDSRDSFRSIRASYDRDLLALNDMKDKRRNAVDGTDESADADRKINEITQRIVSYDHAIKDQATYEQSLRDREKKVEDFTDSLQAANSAVEQADADLKKVIEQMRMTRMDAYSVFGSFDSKGKAEPDSASFQLGKIFATGVASQNISSGLSDMYKGQGDSMVECFRTISKAFSGSDANSASKMRDDLKEMLETCRGQNTGHRSLSQ
jgi:hypothetical protein